MEKLQEYLKSLNPKDSEKHILIFGKKYKLWRSGKYLGLGIWTHDENVGDSFQRTHFDKERNTHIIEVIVADSWELIIEKKLTFRVHFTIDGYEDFFDIVSDDFTEIKSKADREIKKRGLNIFENNIWSEQI